MIALLPKLGAQTQLQEFIVFGICTADNFEIILASLPSSVNKLHIGFLTHAN
jgi:hypothetical protein